MASFWTLDAQENVDPKFADDTSAFLAAIEASLRGLNAELSGVSENMNTYRHGSHVVTVERNLGQDFASLSIVIEKA